MSGRLYLVGAGPGDPGLLTLRGVQCLRRADVVIYDYLANPRLLDHAPATAERILVGKHGGGTRVEQGVINDLILDRAKAGRTVVRLKGGDPFIFGRGGEEAETARLAGIELEIVPGVSAAIAVPAYAGIPLTHRDLASKVIFATGYEQHGKTVPAVDWNKLAGSGSTLVLLMTTRQLAGNMQKLLDGGIDPATPVALIEWGTRAAQRTIVGTVVTIARLAEEHEVKPPALAVVGQVVQLREKIRWCESRALFGRRIALTRPREQSIEFAAALEDLGAETIIAPTIRIAPRPPSELAEAFRRSEEFDWVVFTSANGVKVFFEALREAGVDIRRFHRARIVAIGPQTARALTDRCVRVDLVPEDYRAEGLLEALAGFPMSGQQVLLPRAAGARDLLPAQLSAAGAQITEVHTYVAEPTREGMDFLTASAREGELDLVTFTSSSTVHSFVTAAEGIDLSSLKVGCIGPITADTARSYGMNIVVQPAKYTVNDFVAAIVAYFVQAGDS